MKKLFLVILSLCFIFTISGCASNKTRVGEGAVIGGLLGGAAGGIIGHQSGNAGMGAGIGIAAGAVTGVLIGSQIDKPGAKTAEGETATSSQQPNADTKEAASVSQLSMQQVIEMTKQGQKDDEIIKKIKDTNSKFNLSEEGINYLKKEGVSQKVITAMQGK